MATIEIPKFWQFRLPCSCPYGSVLADQRPHGIIATEEQAWTDFYEGRKRDMHRDRKRGHYVVGVDDFDSARWGAGHSHPDCTRTTTESEEK